MRQVLERLLVEKDWGKVFAQLNFVVKPALDAVFNTPLAEAAAANGDDLTTLMHLNLHLDAARSRRWSVALAQVAVTDAPANTRVLSGWIGEIEAAVLDAVVAASAPLRTQAFALSADETRQAVRAAIQAGTGEIGLGRAA